MGRERRTGLGLGDRLVLIVAWLVTCGLVYLLGFYVGKGTNERRLGLEERVVRLPVTGAPPAEGERAKGGEEFTFYETLGAGGAARNTTGGGPPSTVPRARVDSTATPPPAPRPAPARAPAPERPAAAAAAPAPRPVPAAVSAPAPRATPPVASLPPAAPLAGGAWTVQANPTRTREEAETLNEQLRSRGYQATVVRVLRNGETWYRVQVGRFASPEQAGEMMHRLREHEGVSHVFVASE